MVGLLSAVVLARLFSKEDYATYRQSLMVYTVAAPFLTLGLPQAIYYFMPNHPERKRNILANNISVLAVSGALFTLFLLCGGSEYLARQFNNPDLAGTLRVIAWYPLFLLPVSGLGACLLVNNRAKQVAVYNIGSRLVMLVTVLLPVFIWRTSFAGVVGFVMAAVVVMAPALWLMSRAADTGVFKPDRRGVLDQLKFAVPLGLAGTIGQLSINLDKILISKYYDPETFAVYINGAMEIPLIAMITGSATAVLLPDMTRYIGAANYNEALQLWKRAAVKCALVIYPVMGFLLVMAPDVMVFLYGPKYIESAAPFRLYLLLLPVRVAFFSAIFISSGKSKLVLIMSAVALVLKIPVSLIMFKYAGYLGPIIATLLVVYFWGKLFDAYWATRLLRTTYRKIFPYQQIGRVLLANGAAGAVTYGVVCWLAVPIPIKLGISLFIYTCSVLAMYMWMKFLHRNQIVMVYERYIASRLFRR